MKFDKDTLIFIIKNYTTPFLLIIIIIIQLYNNSNVSNRLTSVENASFNVEQKVGNIQTVLWVGDKPMVTTTPPSIWRWLLNPAKPLEAQLPVKPDNVIDMVYIEKWYKEQDNYYPVWKKIIFAVQDDIYTVWSLYSNKLLKMWWQVSNIKNKKSAKWEKTAVLSFDATNWQNNISLEFYSKIENYNKKAWSFVKLVIEN